MGGFPFRLHPHRGRAVTHLHDDHLVVDEAARRAAKDAGLPWLRGGMVEHCGPAGPVMEAKIYPWGAAHKESMRTSALRDRMWGFTMQGEDLPQPGNRIDLDPSVRDVRGFPVARTTDRPHRFEQAASAYHAPVLQSVLQEMGAEWTVVTTSPDPEATGSYGDFISPVPNSKHVMGTVRMGDDPTTSVVDRWGRFHDVPNLVVADSSVFVTSAGYGPTLTLVALALRKPRALCKGTT
jgi:choline dehydrogenase-like flavoprotein